MKRLSALALTLLLSACPDGGDTTTASTEAASSGGGSTDASGSSGSPTTTNATTATTESPTTTNATSTTATTNDTTGEQTTAPATSTDTASTTDASSTTDGGSTGNPVDPVCGDGKTEGDEACDDSNLKTELSASKMVPLMYDASACIDDCSLVLSECGNGVVDPGEQCDDGNTDSMDACTTSCIPNTKAADAPCKRTCAPQDSCDTNIAGGKITGCDNLQVPNGAAKICFDSSKSVVAKRYFAEGECAAAAQSCTGGLLCPPNVGNVANFNSCPNGQQLVTNTTMALGMTVTTKVCHKICTRDADCRWNAYDSVWAVPGQIRCQTTPDSGGVKICADAQNNK